jgi:hypothetical protein
MFFPGWESPTQIFFGEICGRFPVYFLGKNRNIGAVVGLRGCSLTHMLPSPSPYRGRGGVGRDVGICKNHVGTM